VRPLPNTIRPCQPVAEHLGGDMFVDQVERVVFPVHHVAGWCVVGAMVWAGLIAVSRACLSVVVQLV
jgi:hypothetical protein